LGDVFVDIRLFFPKVEPGFDRLKLRTAPRIHSDFSMEVVVESIAHFSHRRSRRGL
jgi:hypothetical protein